MQNAVGRGDVGHGIEHVAANVRLLLQQRRDLLGVGFVAGDIALGEVEHAAHRIALIGRHLEPALERVRLGRHSDTIGLGHLGGESDQRNGEGRTLAAGRTARAALDAERPGDARQGGAHCAGRPGRAGRGGTLANSRSCRQC